MYSRDLNILHSGVIYPIIILLVSILSLHFFSLIDSDETCSFCIDFRSTRAHMQLNEKIKTEKKT